MLLPFTLWFFGLNFSPFSITKDFEQGWPQSEVFDSWPHHIQFYLLNFFLLPHRPSKKSCNFHSNLIEDNISLSPFLLCCIPLWLEFSHGNQPKQFLTHFEWQFKSVFLMPLFLESIWWLSKIGGGVIWLYPNSGCGGGRRPNWKVGELDHVWLLLSKNVLPDYTCWNWQPYFNGKLIKGGTSLNQCEELLLSMLSLLCCSKINNRKQKTEKKKKREVVKVIPPDFGGCALRGIHLVVLHQFNRGAHSIHK
jgi:hypothetical protein